MSFTWIFVAAGVLLVAGFFREFGLLTWRGFFAAITAAFAFLGMSLFWNTRRRRLLQDIRKREEILRQQEQELERLQKDYAASRDEVEKLTDALQKERANLARAMLLLEAEKKRDLRAARERIGRMSVPELLDAYRNLLKEAPEKAGKPAPPQNG